MNKKMIANIIINLVTSIIYYGGVFLISAYLARITGTHYSLDTNSIIECILIVTLFVLGLTTLLVAWYKFIFYTESKVKNYIFKGV